MARRDFNSYGSRRGNHEVMIRGTFANIRLRNQIAPGTEGGFTRDFTRDDAPVTTIYEASMSYAAAGIPLVVLAGRSTAPARRATGRPREPPCSAFGRSSQSRTSGSTGRI